MGYFSNGTEGGAYQAKYCDNCVHDVKQDCRIWLAHLTYNYDKEAQGVLDYLIPREKDGITNEQCKLFLPRPKP